MKIFRADSLELERLSKKLLDAAHEELYAAYEPSARDIEMVGGRLSAEGQKEINAQRRQLMRDRIIAELKDEGRYKRRRGEQKHRPRDHSPAHRSMLEDLWSEINLLRRLWKDNGIKIETEQAGTGAKEVAIDIVLRRHGEDDLFDQLVNFDKNRRR
jgi:hypothetical protein